MAIGTENIDFKKIVKEAIDERLQKVADEEFTKAKERIEERRSDVIASVVLDVSEFVEYQMMGRELRITVKEKRTHEALQDNK